MAETELFFEGHEGSEGESDEESVLGEDPREGVIEVPLNVLVVGEVVLDLCFGVIAQSLKVFLDLEIEELVLGEPGEEERVEPSVLYPLELILLLGDGLLVAVVELSAEGVPGMEEGEERGVNGRIFLELNHL